MVRRSPPFARLKVGQRDHGVCALCGVDTRRQQGAYHRLGRAVLRRAGREPFRGRGYSEWRPHAWMGPEVGPVRELAMQKYGIPYGRLETDWWDCDHILPVVEGGGACGLEGLRTLCIPCHQAETAALRARLAGARPAA